MEALVDRGVLRQTLSGGRFRLTGNLLQAGCGVETVATLILFYKHMAALRLAMPPIALTLEIFRLVETIRSKREEKG